MVVSMHDKQTLLDYISMWICVYAVFVIVQSSALPTIKDVRAQFMC